jgi:hypothetical protein
MIENLYDLRRKVFDALELRAQIVETQGQDLDIGEHFKVQFTVTHKLFDPAMVETPEQARSSILSF